MDERTLEPIVARVEAGYPLSERALELLERAVQERPGNLDWLLCLAHALINSERAAQALPLLERAAASRPNETLVLLARARALGALERYGEAERDLRAILARSPGHADALRALALLRLRSGAPREAAEMIRRVLAIDPLDEEARAVLAEIEASVGPQPEEPSISRSDFARELQTSLTERGLKSRADAEASLIVVELAPRREVRLSLTELWEKALGERRGHAWFIEDLVGRLSRLKAPERVPPLEQVRERIFPVLRPKSFLERSGPALQSEAPAGLLWLFALDHPDFVSYLPPECSQQWGLKVPEIAEIAMANLGRAPVPPTRYRVGPRSLEPVAADSERWDLLAFEAGDGYDTSRLLSPAHQALLDQIDRIPWVAAMPESACALLARLHDKSALEVLKSIDEGALLYRLEAGRLEPFAK
ncbi:MAG: tetratricopeptide repeat protein [Myxococcales bacterium]|jgi:uncharacterized protein YtpQ (UPF0354 family)